MSALCDALRRDLGAAAMDLGERIPPSWQALPVGAVVLARRARLLREVDGWRAVDDGDEGPDAATLSLAGAVAEHLAHDLQSPLMAATASIELAMDDAPLPLLASLEAAVASLQRVGAAQSLRARRFPRVLGGPPANLAEVFDVVRAPLGAEFSRHRVNLEIIPPPPHLSLGLSEDLAIAVLVQLAENALNASEVGLRVRVFVDPELPEVCVDDEGPGLSERQRACLGTRAWSTRGGSRGLGLWSLRRECALAMHPRVGGGTRARAAAMR